MSVIDTLAAGTELGPCDTTDIGNGQRLVYRHGRDIRYVQAWRDWLVWDGTRWARDEVREVRRRAQDTAMRIGEEIQSRPSEEGRKAMAKHALTSQGDQRIRAMMACAEAIEGVAIRPAELDADPWALNVENGTLDLRTGRLRAHDRRDLLTKRCPVVWDPAAPCPRFERFMLEIMAGDAEMVGFLQRFAGYSLTGVPREEVLVLLYGTGSNGKSKFLETLHAVLGDYAARANFSAFTEQRNDRPRHDLARLAGLRLVSALEVGESGRLDEAVVKQATGGDTMVARRLYQDEFEFMPQWKIWLAANHRPIIRATDYAMWRRVLLVPFEVTFDGEARDDHLIEVLKAEAPGILAWCVAGCLLWQRDGLNPPERVRAATAAYRAESDTLGAFLDERCSTGGSRSESASGLYAAYKGWAEAQGDHAMSGTAFGRKLTDRGIGVSKNSLGRKMRVGIRLRTDSSDGSDPWCNTSPYARA